MFNCSANHWLSFLHDPATQVTLETSERIGGGLSPI
jgi:hypothetical protein